MQSASRRSRAVRRAHGVHLGTRGAISVGTPATTSSPALAVAHGQLPYVDFVYYYGPLAPMSLGLAAVLGGAGLAPAVGLGLVIAYAIVLATYALARTQAGPLGACARGGDHRRRRVLSPTNLSFVLPHTYSATLARARAPSPSCSALHRRPATAQGTAGSCPPGSRPGWPR